LLVSVANADEWAMAFNARVGWIDLKDPSRGPLGRPDLNVAIQFATQMQRRPESCWSIAGGELLDWKPESDSEFCRILGTTGAIKWALAGCARDTAWRLRFAECLARLPSAHQAILVHYADYHACEAPNWDTVLEVASENRLQHVLIDTAVKDGRCLFDHLSSESLQSYIKNARWMGLRVAIAGSLRLEQLPFGCQLGASWVGVRGAVCYQADRTCSFQTERLEQAIRIVRGCSTPDTVKESSHVLG